MNLMFSSDYGDNGGGETSLVYLCEAFAKHNTIVVIVAHDGKLINKLESLGIKTYILNYKNKWKLICTIKAIRRILIDNDITCIHNNDPITSVIFSIASRGLKCQNFWTCHGQWYRFGLIKRKLIQKANSHIFCVSNIVYDNLKTMGFDKVSITYLGVPIGLFENAPSTNIRKEYDLPKDTYLIAVIGRFQRIKGQLKAIKAIERVKIDYPNVICLLIGDVLFGVREYYQYLNEIKNYVTQKDLRDTVIFLGERSDIPQIMKEVNLLVIPSDNESFGMVAIEALASGLPIISTPNDGVSEILSNNPYMIAKTNDYEGIYNSIKQFLDSEQIRNSVAEFEEERKKRFSIERIAHDYSTVFSSVGGEECMI